MAKQSELLRERTEQHKPKNEKSKEDDKNIYLAMQMVITEMYKRFETQPNFKGYEIKFEKYIDIKYMIDFIEKKGKRYEFDKSYIDRKIRPDGGALFLVNKSKNEKLPILIAEIKRQGTNKQRLKEGKERQATGNAIERLGKNLTGIKAMMNHEKITPFICFGWGCDFAPDEKTVLSKVSMLNEFYPLNRSHLYKKDGGTEYNWFSPVSMFFREPLWTVEEMFDIMKELSDAAIRYYIY